jgi:hypothetical protein
MHCDPIVVSALVNYNSFARTMVDTGCLSYGLCDPVYASKQNLRRIEIKPFYMEAFDGEKAARPIREVAVADVDLEGYQEQMWFYIILLGSYDIYLGMPWIRKRNVEIDEGGNRLRIKSGPGISNRPRVVVRNQPTADSELKGINLARLISAAA